MEQLANLCEERASLAKAHYSSAINWAFVIAAFILGLLIEGLVIIINIIIK